MKKEIRKHSELKKNENTTYQKFWDAAETVLKDKIIAQNIYVKKKIIKSVVIYIQKLAKSEKINHKENIRNEIVIMKNRSKWKQIKMKTACLRRPIKLINF